MSQLRKIEPVDITQDDPWKNDVLHRKKVAEYLTPILATIVQPFVIAIDAPYGTGKTTFVRAWQKDLERQNWPSVYFNAWETDTSQNPMLAFMGAVRRQLPKIPNDRIAEAARTEESPLRRLANNLFAKEGLVLIGKIAARAAVGSELMKEFADIGAENRKDVEAAAGKVVGTFLDKEAEAQATVEEFRSYLGGVLTRSLSGEASQSRPLIVFVDELDRCRPTYAIETIESIKHFFSVNNMVFVLTVDDDHLRSAIAAVYGTQLDATGYLRRFIDWRVSLPAPEPQAYALHLCKIFGLDTLSTFNGRRTWESSNDLSECFGYFAWCLKLSLRDQERAFTHLNLVARAIGANASPLAGTLGAFAALYSRMPEELRGAARDLSALERFLTMLDPLMRTLEAGNVFCDWKRMRPLFHSWFLSEDNAARIGTEATDQSAISNDASKTNAIRESARTRSEYLSDVWNFFNDIRKHFRGRSSSACAATITLDRLEVAAKLSPNR